VIGSIAMFCWAFRLYLPVIPGRAEGANPE
jgi:hypothetical protein